MYIRPPWPFEYLPLQPVDRAAAAAAALSNSAGGMLKFRLGVITSRFRANHPLKACPDCMVADGAAWGTPYWHLPHQFPGVWTCPQHGALLLESSVKSTGVGRFTWALPHAASLVRVADPCSPSTMSALARLAALVVEWSRPDACTGFVATQLAEAYRARAAEVFGTPDLRPRTRSVMSAAFYESVAPLRVIPELWALPASHQQAAAQIQRWLSAPRGGTHPLRHLAIIYWLFDDWAHFQRGYAAASCSTGLVQGAKSAVSDLPDPRVEAFLTAVLSGESVSSAARAVGVAVNTGMAWAARHDIAVHRRPKVLQPAVRNTLIDGLRRGADKTALAERSGVSVQAVTRMLQSEVGLRSAWTAAQEERRRREARRAWVAAMKKSDGLPLTLVRLEAQGAYAWLYRHDRAWLALHRPRDAADLGPVGSRVDWDARDVVLSLDVRRVAAELATAQCVARVELWQLYQRLPELKAKLGSLRRLPLTLKAIQETTGRRRGTAGTQLF